MYDGEIVGVDLPAAVELTVTETEPGIQGDRVSGARKPATLETGLVLQVPLFVNIGDRVKVDTRSGEYLTRAGSLTVADRVLPSTRREARERALGLLYEAESKSAATGGRARLTCPCRPILRGRPRRWRQKEQHRDRRPDLAANAIGWSVHRMPVVDRALLRMATYELLARPDVPTGAVISEAVELATEYSTEESGRFVNGVLATIAVVVRPET